MTPAETLRLYRTDHRIALIEDGRWSYRCATDGIRVLSMRDGRYRHHPDDIVRLLDAEYGGPWGTPKAVPIDDFRTDQHGEACWYAGHVKGCACRAGADVELLPGWIETEIDGVTVVVEMAP